MAKRERARGQGRRANGAAASAAEPAPAEAQALPAAPRANDEPAPLFIHIGAHKAGSSTIQRFMHEHEKALSRHGILYPKNGRAPRGAHHQFAKTLGKRFDAEKAARLWARIRSMRSKAAPGQRVFLSAEGFENLAIEEIRQLKTLAGDGPITILYYIRDLAGAIVAAYGQRTKIGNNQRDFDDFFTRNIEDMAENRLRVVRSWMEVFGAGNCHIRPLDAEALAGGDLVEDVLRTMGLSLATLGLTAAPRKNVSPGWKMTETLRAAWGLLASELGERGRKRLAPRLVEAAEEAAAKFGADKERGDYLTLEQRRICDALTAKLADEISALQPHTGFRLVTGKAASERPFLPSIEQVPSAEAVRLVSHVMAKLLTDSSNRLQAIEDEDEDEEAQPLDKKAARRAARAARNKARAQAAAA